MRLHRPARSSTVDGALNPVVALIRPRQIDSHCDYGLPQRAIAYGLDARRAPTTRNQAWQHCTALD
ncbi:hypothetical protein GFM44_39900, partial [Rhizobium leguminosarum bv. viciae]|nr:hypothetical protein [Rhizobium leguminosarum bv. viciae]